MPTTIIRHKGKVLHTTYGLALPPQEIAEGKRVLAKIHHVPEAEITVTIEYDEMERWLQQQSFRLSC